MKMARKTGLVFILASLFLSVNTNVYSQAGGAAVPFLLISPDARGSGNGGNAPWRAGKGTLFEGGLRVPFIARWPGRVAAGATSSHVAYFGDLFATFAELLGQSPPAGLDSVSLAPTLLGRPSEQGSHPYLYWEFYELGGRQAVRFDRWKAIREPSGENVGELSIAGWLVSLRGGPPANCWTQMSELPSPPRSEE